MAQIQIPQIDPETAKQIKSVSTRSLACLILSVIAAFWGGVILGGIGFLIGFSAWRKIGRIADRIGNEDFAYGMRRAVKRSLIVSGILLALNTIALIVMWPTVMYVAQTGDYSALFTMNPISSATGGSIWD